MAHIPSGWLPWPFSWCLPGVPLPVCGLCGRGLRQSMGALGPKRELRPSQGGRGQGGCCTGFWRAGGRLGGGALGPQGGGCDVAGSTAGGEQDPPRLTGPAPPWPRAGRYRPLGQALCHPRGSCAQGQRGSRKAVLPQERVIQRLGEVTLLARAGPGGGDGKQAETGRQVPLLGKRVPLGFQARRLCLTRPRGGGRGFPALAR